MYGHDLGEPQIQNLHLEFALKSFLGSAGDLVELDDARDIHVKFSLYGCFEDARFVALGHECKACAVVVFSRKSLPHRGRLLFVGEQKDRGAFGCRDKILKLEHVGDLRGEVGHHR